MPWAGRQDTGFAAPAQNHTGRGEPAARVLRSAGMELHERLDWCPYCGERLELLVDDSELQQEYTEDCQVCCRPIVVSVHGACGDELTISLRREDD